MWLGGDAPARQHRYLFNAALKRDADAATDVLVKHIRDCVQHTIKSGALAS